MAYKMKIAGIHINFRPQHIQLISVISVAVIIMIGYYLYGYAPSYRAPKFDGIIPDVHNIGPAYQSFANLTFKDRKFYLANKEVCILSGALHYFRVLPEYWSDRMLKMKACGLNTIETYVPWNLHQPFPGKFDFKGMLNIREFINTAKYLGLHVLLRPGPYICSEWDFGGLPGWLLRDPHMKVRTNYEGYMSAVDKYFSKLIPEIADLQYSRGGPIIAIQVENEFGSFSTEAEHLGFIKKTLQKYGAVEMFFTSDGWNYKNRLGTAVAPFYDNALPTANFQSFVQGAAIFDYIKAISPDFPLMNMEFWVGWFDHWGEPTHRGHATFEEVGGYMEEIFKLKASINIYMFHGGTNFGFTAGANYFDATNYQPVVTSYDYDAPLSEAGDITPKYKKIRELLHAYYPEHTAGHSLPIPPDVPKFAYGIFKINGYLPFEKMLGDSMVMEKQSSQKLLYMEETSFNNDQGQTTGYILYRKVIQKGTLLKIRQPPRDHLQILVNGESVGIYNWTHPNVIHQFSSLGDTNVLDLLVENLGRVNYVTEGSKKMNRERKGLQGKVYLDDEPLYDWTIFSLDFKQHYLESLQESEDWQTTLVAAKTPAMFRAHLTISGKPLDTYLLMTGWGKGEVFVNNFNLGRYWDIGPQMTLYIPGPLLKPGSNVILIFEEQKIGKKIEFVDKPVLG